jgi:hypothetical protein
MSGVPRWILCGAQVLDTGAAPTRSTQHSLFQERENECSNLEENLGGVPKYPARWLE